jgi:hypothetical protein
MTMIPENTPTLSTAERMFRLFAGNERRHIRGYGPPVILPMLYYEEKRWLDFRTYNEPVTLDHWVQHLDPASPYTLSIIPLLDDGTCWWACIDVDYFECDLYDFCQRIEKLKFPLVTCTSKGAGWHLFVFFKEPVRAELVIPVLRFMALRQGFVKYRLFPSGTGPEELMRGVAMPYGPVWKALAEQCARSETGNAMLAREFVYYVEDRRITPAELPDMNQICNRPRGKRKDWNRTLWDHFGI